MSDGSYFSSPDSLCESPLTFSGSVAVVVVFCVMGMLWAFRNVRKVIKINLEHYEDIDMEDTDHIGFKSITPSQQKLLL
jgi:hypothetical protein